MGLKPFIFAFAVVGLAVPASAITQISTPDSDYKDETNLLGVAAPNGPNRSATGDLDLTVNFSSILDPRLVGQDWGTWGTPPDTEYGTPPVWYTLGATSLTFTFSDKLSIWGFEAEGNPFDDRLFTVEYYQGATLLGTISRTINGNGGARLLAAVADPGTYFTSVRVYSDVDFAVAHLRYQISAVPEPATWAMLIAGFSMVGFAARRRRSLAQA